MIVWTCNKCGCQVKEMKPTMCPLCKRIDSDFSKHTISDSSDDDKVFSKKYEEVIEELEKYTEDCEPLIDKYSVED